MCLAQEPQRSDAGEARTRSPSVLSQALNGGGSEEEFSTLPGCYQNKRQRSLRGRVEYSALGDYTDPGPCGAEASVYLPFQTYCVDLKQPVSKHGSIHLGELVAIKMVLDFIFEKLPQKIQLNRVLILSDSQ